jgi:hypothetical protein
VTALAAGVFPFNRWTAIIGGFFLASIAATFAAGQTEMIVLLYGLRINYLHLPLIWIMAAVLERKDIKWMGAFILLMALAMAPLMVKQFQSPMDAWVNRGIGDGPVGQIFGAEGRIRPPGFFAFITGPQLFLPLATAFFLYEVSGKNRRTLPWVILLAAGTAIAICLPVSISRTAMLGAGLVGVAFVVSQLLTSRSAASVIYPVLSILVLLVALSFLPIFKEGQAVFLSRWETAASDTDGNAWESVRNRTIDGMFMPFTAAATTPLFGAGIGVGSNVGARLTTGTIGFALAEDEWTKTIMELGPFLGVGFILFRILLTLHLGLSAMRSLLRDRDPAAFLVFTATGVAVFQLQWAPPTILGFAVFGAGCVLALAKPIEEPVTPDETAGPDANAAPVALPTSTDASHYRPSARIKPPTVIHS